jgi:hydroxymethylglutaryl-CoA lyase
MSRAVLVSEVGPRDGLQSIARRMPLADKCAWIAAEAAAGVREIEVGSFVNPKLVPQLADTAAVVEFARTIPGLTVAALAANRRGGGAALAAGAHKITVPVSVSETHSLRNVRRTPLQMLEEVRAIAALIRERPQDRRPALEGSLSTAFGCTLEGNVPAQRVVTLAAALLEAGCDEVSLADTTGYANPAQVKSLIREVRASVGEAALVGLHLHNTRGLGLANVLAGLDLGIGTFDSSLAGLGGCPFAPGASGNVVTEDLVFMLESMGIDTGIDLERLIAVRALVSSALPGEPLYGFTAQAGLPRTFAQAPGPPA